MFGNIVMRITFPRNVENLNDSVKCIILLVIIKILPTLSTYYHRILLFLANFTCNKVNFSFILIIVYHCRITWSGFYLCDIECRCGACHHGGMCPRKYIVMWMWYNANSCLSRTGTRLEMGRMFSGYRVRNEVCTKIPGRSRNRRGCAKPNESAQQSSGSKGIHTLPL